MKRRAFSLILALILILTCAACTQNAPQEPISDEPKVVEPAPQPLPEPEPDPEPLPEPEPEYTLPREDGANQLTFYFAKDGVDWSKADMWIWFPGKDGRGYEFHTCDYGGKVILNVPESVTEVGFIVRTNCSQPGGTSWGDAVKDVEADRYAEMTGPDTVIYLKSGDSMQYTSKDGGKTVDPIKLFSLAGITGERTIRYVISPATRFESLEDFTVTDSDGNSLAIESVSSLNNSVILGDITLAEPLDLSDNYTLAIKGFGELTSVPTGIFDSAEFNEKYLYDGPLGARRVDDESWAFNLWAPTSSAVTLNLYQNGSDGEKLSETPMEKLDKGVWSATLSADAGTYYTYTVTNALGTFEVVDPYAEAVGVNGERGMLLDYTGSFSDLDRYFTGIESYSDAVIWEVHVRDFSNTIGTSKYPGKYLAFTEEGLVNGAGVPIGLDYLKELGITHIHLQPIYDYATVDEARLDLAQFNWGYDPKNYNAPEGSYSTAPFEGETRVTELRALVKAIHDAGMGVIMDVVYNHTYSLDSNLNRIVPYYYYRYNAMGEASNGSGCGNETASDRAMFRRFMVDSISHWQRDYHIDGFRFDLMALHDIDTMQAIESAVHAENPKAIIYGEGWTGGTSALNANLQANQQNISKVVASEGAIGSVAVFNDAIRDGLKGSVFDAKGAGYASGNITKTTANQVLFGIEGGKRGVGAAWGVENNMVINYVSAHDNNTLWDKLALSNGDEPESERFKMNAFAANIIFISNGTPFMLAGEEMLRTKGGDENSYMSSDEVNNLEWSKLIPGSPEFEMMRFYKSLIDFRKAHDYLRQSDVTGTVLPDNSLEVHYSADGAEKAVAFINPHTEPIKVHADGTMIWRGGEVNTAVSGESEIPPRTVVIVEK